MCYSKCKKCRSLNAEVYCTVETAAIEDKSKQKMAVALTFGIQ